MPVTNGYSNEVRHLNLKDMEPQRAHKSRIEGFRIKNNDTEVVITVMCKLCSHSKLIAHLKVG